MKITIATKILGIAAIIVVAMAGAAAVNLYATRNVAADIDRLSDHYLVAYGATSRLNVYSLRQALQFRRYVGEKLLGIQQPGSSFTETMADINLQGDNFRKEIALARSLIREEIDSPEALADRAKLGRIDERLAWIAEEHEKGEARTASSLSFFEKNDLATFRANFVELNAWRASFNDYINETRLMINRLAAEAGKQAARNQAKATRLGALILALASTLAIIVALLLTRQFVHPLRKLLQGTLAVTAGDFDVRLPITSTDEIGTLTHSFNKMTEELRTVSRAREMFGRYLDSQVAKNLIEAPHLLGESGERRVMTIMFCDLEGFTSLGENMTPRGLVAVINRYFTLMSESVNGHKGVIDKFIGDSVMAYWGPPFGTEGEQARQSALSALEQIGKMDHLQTELPDLLNLRQGLPRMNARIGIATGEVLVGSIGSNLMRNFTVMGDPVNMASRLESTNKVYGTHILVCEETARRIGPDLELREIDRVIVAGRSHAVSVFEVMGLSGKLTDDQERMRRHFASGLGAYRQKEWAEAHAGFTSALEAVPGDRPSQVFLDRIAELREASLPETWDGIWTMQGK